MVDYGIAPTARRLPEELRLGTVTLQVSDLGRSLEFYAGLLGMHVLSEDDDAARLGGENAAEALLELRAGAARPRPQRGRLGLYHFAVLLPDRPALGRILSHLRSAGVQPGAADHLVSEALYLQDPDDLGIEIYRDRPRHEWTTHGRQLAMSSDPLDTRGVLGAADGAAWEGMPPDTRIGHMHLHVGSIDTARVFYHETLGFDVTVWSYPGALFMSAGGYHHHLGVNTWAGAHAEPPREDEPRLLSWEIVLPAPPDVAAVVEGAAAAGARTGGDGILVDPWGTAVRVRH